MDGGAWEAAVHGAQAHVRWMLPLVVLAWETFQESYSVPPREVSEDKGKSNNGLGGMELKINPGYHQVYP